MLPALTNNSGRVGRKPFYKTPQGVVGAIFLGIGITLFGYYVAPVILSAVTNMLMLAGVLGGTALVGGAIYTNRLRLWYGYLNYTRKFINALVPIEAIDVMKIYIKRLKQKMVDMEEQIMRLEGVVKDLLNSYNDNIEEIKDLKARWEVAKQQGQGGQATVYSNQIGRLKGSNDKSYPLIMQLKGYVVALDKMKEGAGLIIQDMQNDISSKEKEYRAIKQAHSAIKSVQSIFNGDPDERAMFEDALEVMKMDMNNRIAEFERIMRQNESVLKNIDIQKGVDNIKGLQVIEELSKDNFDYLLRPLATRIEDIDAEVIRPINLNTPQPQPITAKPVNSGNNKYTNFLQ